MTYESFRNFFKGFNVLEYKCPPNKRISDDDLLQLVGQLVFIKDPSARKTWTDHVNAPRVMDVHGNQISGPPQTFADAKLLWLRACFVRR